MSMWIFTIGESTVRGGGKNQVNQITLVSESTQVHKMNRVYNH